MILLLVDRTLSSLHNLHRFDQVIHSLEVCYWNSVSAVVPVLLIEFRRAFYAKNCKTKHKFRREYHQAKNVYALIYILPVIGWFYQVLLLLLLWNRMQNVSFYHCNRFISLRHRHPSISQQTITINITR